MGNQKHLLSVLSPFIISDIFKLDFIKLIHEEKAEQTNDRLESTLSMSSSTEDEQTFLKGEAPQKQDSEKQTVGTVKGAIYWIYIKSGAGFFMLSFFIIINIVTQILFNGSDYYLSLWTDKERL